ncbi:AtpZ/AtpI family protein [Ancylobacter mangrovi]|uniref:AtpZ/AtpI family protein n=1 Tax=Ancylobacter mangrovi TaxID=2972472 RepID=A0A9X2PDH2_9HYPH|nr:AtpZ/AtpI family protein [Ancylobacter mangrovi]MCS0495379.1 AtpZ/AtpI family protein [Ancylobacter mangrovi]MCS0503025.1 AtpZ/AtpI family protein [Ancylobacter mangrovi]
MDDRDKTDGQKGSGSPEISDAELSGRLHGLGRAIDKVRAERKVDEEEVSLSKDRTSTSAGMTLAFRLGSEFVAGVLVGAGLGWGFDRLLGTSPWGFIVFLLLGFAASILNMMRAAGETGRKTPPEGGA